MWGGCASCGYAAVPLWGYGGGYPAYGGAYGWGGWSGGYPYYGAYGYPYSYGWGGWGRGWGGGCSTCG
jgi:hypothetical protein